MNKADCFSFGFFFTGPGAGASHLYFAAFQCSASRRHAHQVIISEVSEDFAGPRKVAYAIDPAEIVALDQEELEKICRIAVNQFLGKLANDNFLAHVLPLELSGVPWDGQVLTV
jgi:hypothetical protein